MKSDGGHPRTSRTADIHLRARKVRSRAFGNRHVTGATTALSSDRSRSVGVIPAAFVSRFGGRVKG